MNRFVGDEPIKGNPRSSGYARAAEDWYVEPPEAVEALFNAELFHGLIYDPACGSGTIVKTARATGYRAAGSDIINRGFAQAGICDFLADRWLDGVIDNIVSNPPYKYAEMFIERAIDTADRKVAMLLRLSFLEGQRRAKLFAKTPLARVHVFSWRISMPSGTALASGSKQKGGSVAFAWFVWDHAHPIGHPPELRWLMRPQERML